MKIAIEFAKHMMPHQLHLGDRVYQRVNPWHQGTVTQVDGHGFTVTYDREKGEPRSRFSYPASRSWDFLVGRPSSELLQEAQAPGS